jgi:uncharacterized protein YciI
MTALISVSIVSGISCLALLIGANALASQLADDAARSWELARLLRIGALFVPLFALTQVLRYCTQAYKFGGDVLTTDGPFAESKEHLGRFYIIEAEDLDAALAWAPKTSAAVTHPIEVRPFRDVSGA